MWCCKSKYDPSPNESKIFLNKDTMKLSVARPQKPSEQLRLPSKNKSHPQKISYKARSEKFLVSNCPNWTHIRLLSRDVRNSICGSKPLLIVFQVKMPFVSPVYSHHIFKRNLYKPYSVHSLHSLQNHEKFFNSETMNCSFWPSVISV